MRFPAHSLFGTGLLPWLFLYAGSLVASYASASTEQPHWANRIAVAVGEYKLWHPAGSAADVGGHKGLGRRPNL